MWPTLLRCSHSVVAEAKKTGLYGHNLHEGEESMGWSKCDSPWPVGYRLGCGRDLFSVLCSLRSPPGRSPSDLEDTPEQHGELRARDVNLPKVFCPSIRTALNVEHIVLQALLLQLFSYILSPGISFWPCLPAVDFSVSSSTVCSLT